MQCAQCVQLCKCNVHNVLSVDGKTVAGKKLWWEGSHTGEHIKSTTMKMDPLEKKLGLVGPFWKILVLSGTCWTFLKAAVTE